MDVTTLLVLSLAFHSELELILQHDKYELAY